MSISQKMKSVLKKKIFFSRGDVSYICVHFRAFCAFFRVFFCVFAAFYMKKTKKNRVCRSRHIRTPHMVHAYFISCNTIGIYTECRRCCDVFFF